MDKYTIAPPAGSTNNSVGAEDRKWKEGHFEKLVADDVVAKGPVVDVRAFGAKGDGVTDDTAAIQAALNQYRTIYIPAGRYIIKSTLNISTDKRIIGANMRYTQMVFERDGIHGVDVPYIQIENLSMWGSETFTGIDISANDEGCPYAHFERLLITGFTYSMKLEQTWCVEFLACRFGIRDIGMTLHNCNNITFDMCQFLRDTKEVDTGIGVLIDKDNGVSHNITFYSCDFERMSKAIDASLTENICLYNSYYEDVDIILNVKSCINVIVNGGHAPGCKKIITGGTYMEEEPNVSGKANIKNLDISYSWANNDYLCSADNNFKIVLDNIHAYNMVGTLWANDSIINSWNKNVGMYREIIKKSNTFLINWNSEIGVLDSVDLYPGEQVKLISVKGVVQESFTSTTSCNFVIGTTSDIALMRVIIPAGTYQAGDTIDAINVIDDNNIAKKISNNTSDFYTTVSETTDVIPKVFIEAKFQIGKFRM